MVKVTLRQVKKAYGDTEVIHGIDMNIDRGEFIVVVGPSGCGKSTLLRMLAGLETITDGEVFIDDACVNELEPMERNIAMVFQNYALYPHMTVFNNMAYSLKISGVAKAEIEQRVQQVADLLQLTDYLQRKPQQLSGGPASARRHGTGDRPQAGTVFVRRAAIQPRCQVTGADAAGNPQPAAQTGGYFSLR